MNILNIYKEFVRPIYRTWEKYIFVNTYILINNTYGIHVFLRQVYEFDTYLHLLNTFLLIFNTYLQIFNNKPFFSRQILIFLISAYFLNIFLNFQYI